MKCEVLKDTTISVAKGSIVIVTEKQFELARKVLKPVVEKATSTKEEVVEEAPKPKSKKK